MVKSDPEALGNKKRLVVMFGLCGHFFPLSLSSSTLSEHLGLTERDFLLDIVVTVPVPNAGNKYLYLVGLFPTLLQARCVPFGVLYDSLS